MSQASRLISELCPEGVQFMTLGETGWFYGGLTGKTKKDFGVGDGRYIPYKNIFDNEATDLSATESVSVGPEERQNRVHHGDVLFTGSSESLSEAGMSSVVTDVPGGAIYLNSFSIGFRWHDPELLLPGFAAHLFRSDSMRRQIIGTANGVTRFNISKVALRKVSIPVPPLAVQQVIVDVLDTMKQLEAELRAELTAELEARRRQYLHYRTLQLSFDEGVEWGSLADVARNHDAARKPVTKAARRPGPYPYYGASGMVDKVDDYLFDGDYLLVSEDGANLLARSSPIAFSVIGKTWVNNHAHVLEFRTEAARRFVEYYLNMTDLEPFLSGAAQPKLNQASLNRIPIPIVPAVEQERIVARLDKLDLLVNDHSAGLSAELTARRTQYEYYRDLLLSFQEKSA